MLAKNLLRAKIAEKELTEKAVATAIGITLPTFKVKIEGKKGCFDLKEVENLIQLLDIKNPAAIFFAPDVAYSTTSPLDEQSGR